MSKSVWRKLLSARSSADASRIWHANKLTSPTVRAWLQYTHGAKVALYNTQKKWESFGESRSSASGTTTASVAFMVSMILHFIWLVPCDKADFAQVTHANKLKMKDLGYSDAAIAKMKPAIALGVIAEGISPSAFTEWLPLYESKLAANAEQAKADAMASVNATPVAPKPVEATPVTATQIQATVVDTKKTSDAADARTGGLVIVEAGEPSDKKQ